MKLKPFFSVIIPTYNHANYLKKALDSVLAQSFNNYEIIVIDDNSTDNTRAVVNNYKNKIIYKKISNNRIIGRSRNLGISISKGEWLAFLDSDDEWLKDKLHIVFNFIKKNNKYQIICNNELIFRNSKKMFSNYGPFVENFYERLLVEGNCISTSASIVNKNFLFSEGVRFSEKKEFIGTEDYDFFLQLAKKNAKFFFIKNFLGVHNYYHGSVSSNYFRHKRAIIHVIKNHLNNNFKFKKKMILLKKIKYNLEFKDMLFFIKKKNFKKFILIFFKLFFSSPYKFMISIFVKLKFLYQREFNTNNQT